MVTCGRSGQPYERRKVQNQAPTLVSTSSLLFPFPSTQPLTRFPNTVKTRMGPMKEYPHGPT